MNTNEISTTAHVEVVGPETGPVFSDAELAAIDTIANGGAVDGIDVNALDAAILAGINAGMDKANKALVDVAGYMGAALKVRTWTRIIDPDTRNLFASEARFVEWTLSGYPLLGTVVRREVMAVIDGVTDAKGKPLSGAKLGKLLGISKQTVSDERKIIEGGEQGGERGPQTGGQVEPDATAVKRYVSSLATNAGKVRDAESSMTVEQLLAVADEGRELVKTAIATLRLRFPETEVPEWAAFIAAPAGPGRLRSGAEGTVASGPVLAGAPADPTAIAAAPAKPKPKPRAAAAS